MATIQGNRTTNANLFSVFLHDNDGQSILGIDDGSVRQSLTLELTNSSQQPIVIKPLTKQPDSQYYHFELAFRPGTILQGKINDIDLPESQKSEWQMRRANDSFYFTYIKKEVKRELKPGERLTLTLDNISAEPAGGSRGTRVELRYQNLSYAETNSPISGTQLQYLNIINQRGSKQLPLYVGFIGSPTKNDMVNVLTPQTTEASPSVGINDDGKVSNSKPPETQPLNSANNPKPIHMKSGVVGSNRVLNDGETPNSLILAFYFLDRLQATADKTRAGISLRGSKSNQNDGSKFKIAFDVIPDTSEDIGYGLFKESQAKNVNISIANTTSGKANWEVKPNTQGNVPEWTITCKKDVLVQQGEILQLKITKLITALQAGYANLYVYYENIPGYWDGHIICPIEKGPLMLGRDTNNNNKESVGIGTDAPSAKLHVKQGDQSSIWVATFEGPSGVLITGAKGQRNALSLDNIETESPALAVNQKGTGLAAKFTAPVWIDVANSNTNSSTLVIKGTKDNHNALYIDARTTNAALGVVQQGTGTSIFIKAHSSRPALLVEQEGPGTAAYFSNSVMIDLNKSKVTGSSLQINGTKDAHSAIYISKANTSKPALYVEQEGKGNAAFFSGSVRIDDEKSELNGTSLAIHGTHGDRNALQIHARTSSPALSVNQEGKGAALQIQARTSSPALFVGQEGKGQAATFTGHVSIGGGSLTIDKTVITSKSLKIGNVEITERDLLILRKFANSQLKVAIKSCNGYYLDNFALRVVDKKDTVVNTSDNPKATDTVVFRQNRDVGCEMTLNIWE